MKEGKKERKAGKERKGREGKGRKRKIDRHRQTVNRPRVPVKPKTLNVWS